MSDLKSQAKSGRRSVWKVSRAMTVIAALFLASCAPAVQGDGDQGSLQPPQTQPPHTQPSPNESEDQSGQSLISKDEVDSDHGNLANMLRQSSLEDGLILWGTQTVVAGWEVEQYTDFAEMASRASVVVVARVVGRGPDRHLEGDPGTDDKLTYSSTEIEVVESLAGDASIRAGDRLIVEHFAPSAAAGIDTVGLFFLRYKLHNRMGEEYEQARQEEAGLYRLISHQGVFIDRGDGVPIGPQIEVLRLLDSGLDMPLDEFVFDGPPPDPSEYQLAATARNMSMDELIALVRRAGFK